MDLARARVKFLIEASSLLVTAEAIGQSNKDNTDNNQPAKYANGKGSTTTISSQYGRIAKRIKEKMVMRTSPNLKCRQCSQCQCTLLPGINYQVRHNKKTLTARRRSVNCTACRQKKNDDNGPAS